MIQPEFARYTVGDRLVCDFHFGGKPDAECVEVVVPGNGRNLQGTLRVRILDDHKGYRKDEIIEIGTFWAVPKKHLFRRGYHLHVGTNYCWE